MQRNLPLIKGTVLLLTLSLGLAFNVSAQTRITGKVIASDDNQPIIGASVKLKSKSGGSQTDANGSFSVTALPSDVLIFSFVGYSPKEVTVGDQKIINVTLQASPNSLVEVVVTGYTAQRKKDLTGAVSVVNITQLKSQPAASAVEGLQGRAPGVQIITDGAPGSSPQIRIRGTSTIGSNNPLYVIDGVPFEGNLFWLNQNDIESLQVLKDASSASIYGARANNGVVIITTKRGKEGTPSITFDTYYGIQAPRKGTFPEMMNPLQYAQYLSRAYTNAGKVAPPSDNYGSGSNPTLPEYLLAGAKFGQKITPADSDPAKYRYTRNSDTFYQITRANQQGTNWFDEITENAPIQNYHLSASGGGENAVYSFSGGYLNQKGTIKNTGFSRYTLRNNSQFTALDKRLRFGQNAQYAYTEGFGLGVNPTVPGEYQDQGSAIAWAYRMPTIVPVYDIKGNFAGSKGSDLGNAENPVAVLHRAKDNINRSNFFFGNAFAEIDLIEGLVARTNFGLHYENYNGVAMRYPNLEYQEGNNSNNLTEYQGYRTEWTWTNTLNYNKVFDKHRIGVLAGMEAIKSRTRQLDAGRNDFFLIGDPNYYYLGVGASNISNTSIGEIGSMFSLFAKADYSYNDRYLASITIRRDGSSNFGEANKYGYFPAVSAAWRISEENFMKSDFITDLKIRAGYGETGNQRINRFQYLNRFQSSLNNGGYALGGGNEVNAGINQIAYGNPDVRWESVASINLGVDFTLNGGTFDGSFDWYDKKTSDMLYTAPLPATAVGMGASPFVNAGDMSNKGVELTLGYHSGIKNDSPFKFDAVANISRNVNKIIKLADGITDQRYGVLRSLTTSILHTGSPFGSFYGYKVAGIFQNQNELTSLPAYSGARVGGFRYEDINGDGAITTDDRTIIGNPHPDFIYSLNLTASYKNFDILAYFNGVQGNDLYEATRYFTDFGSFPGAKSTRLLNEWSPSNPTSMVPSVYNGASNLELESSSYYVQNGSYLRMKNLQIGYTLPKKVFNSKLGINKMRFYVSATNIFTITNYTGLDPEVSQETETYSALGVDVGVYPSPRQFLLGLSVGF